MVEDENALMMQFMENNEFVEEYRKLNDLNKDSSPLSPIKTSLNRSKVSFSPEKETSLSKL